MIDQSTPKGRIVAAAVRLAAERPWREVALADIADASFMTLADIRREVSSKGEIVAAFARMIDDEVLSKPLKRAAGQPPRDAVFEIVMSRFDAMQPYKSALKSISEGGAADLMLVQSFISSQAWMLNAAGVATDGIEGNARVLGLATVYASVFRTWLDDDDPGLARTMAALDRRLRRGESMSSTVDDVVGTVRRVAGMFTAGWGGIGGRRGHTSDVKATSGAAAPPPAS